MNLEDGNFLKHLYQQVMDEPLDHTDPRYVPVYDLPGLDMQDPVEQLAKAVEWTPGDSVQLLSGFRGTGKSTELRRLRARLQSRGYEVLLCDLEDYLNMSTPVDISDFILAVAGALGEGLHRQGLTGDAVKEGAFERMVRFLKRTKVELPELSAAGIRANLKEDPSFRKKLQENMAGHIGALTHEIRVYVEECVSDLRDKRGADRELVLLVDSIEHIRGTSINADDVHASVETLFASHADKLRLPGVHVVYTVPPYIKVLHPNIGARYRPGKLHLLPAIKVRDPQTDALFAPGIDALAQVVDKRGDWQRLLGTRPQLERLCQASGGHFRDLLRLVSEVVMAADALPVTPQIVTRAIENRRRELLPLPEQDAVRLWEVASTKRAPLKDRGKLQEMARFLETHLVLCYHNGHEWYDVHPLVREHVRELAGAMRVGSGGSGAGASPGSGD